jgi:hypothetical protein
MQDSSDSGILDSRRFLAYNPPFESCHRLDGPRGGGQRGEALNGWKGRIANRRPKALGLPPEAFAQAGRWSPCLYFMTAMFK